jgi:hypothetical protein
MALRAQRRFMRRGPSGRATTLFESDLVTGGSGRVFDSVDIDLALFRDRTSLCKVS